jgi:hypothetical protein
MEDFRSGAVGLHVLVDDLWGLYLEAGEIEPWLIQLLSAADDQIRGSR